MPETDTSTPDSVKAKWPKDTLVAKLKASLTFCEDAFAQLDDAKLSDQVAVSFGGNTRNVTRVSMALGNVLDLADHYSQIANYMRLNNLLPPRTAAAGPRLQVARDRVRLRARARAGQEPFVRLVTTAVCASSYHGNPESAIVYAAPT